MVFVIVIVLLLIVPIVLVSRRLMAGDDVEGGSFGEQIGRKDDDWGPHSDT